MKRREEWNDVMKIAHPKKELKEAVTLIFSVQRHARTPRNQQSKILIRPSTKLKHDVWKFGSEEK